MRAHSSARWAAALALVLAGCTQVVDVGDYTFDLDPCGVRPPACSGGTERTYVIVGSDVPRLDGQGRRDGFDLDATDERICGQPDFVSPSGAVGIDNQIAGMLELLESLDGSDLRATNRATYVRGEELSMLFLANYDGGDDDCVEVTYRTARPPEGTPVEALDADGDGELDEGLTFDFGPPLLRDATACVIDGELHARFPESLVSIPTLRQEVTIQRGRLRMPLEDPDRITGAMLGSALRLDDLATVLPTELVEFVRPRADLAPSSRDARDCTSISSAILLDAVPAVRGSLL